MTLDDSSTPRARIRETRAHERVDAPLVVGQVGVHIDHHDRAARRSSCERVRHNV